MKGIARFFTLYWIIYFPTCIAYNDLPGFSSIDEMMTIILFLFTLLMYRKRYINRRPLKEYLVCLSIIAFYFVYSLFWGANVLGGILLDLMPSVYHYFLYLDSESSILEETEKMDAGDDGLDIGVMDNLSSGLY